MRGALLYAIFSSFLFQDAGCFIEVAGLTVDLHRAVCHCASDGVKVVGAVLVGVSSLDHLAVGIIADPLAAVRFLVNILGNCLCAVGIVVQPVLAITFGDHRSPCRGLPGPGAGRSRTSSPCPPRFPSRSWTS